jgi:hypothetical protein
VIGDERQPAGHLEGTSFGASLSHDWQNLIFNSSATVAARDARLGRHTEGESKSRRPSLPIITPEKNAVLGSAAIAGGSPSSKAPYRLRFATASAACSSVSSAIFCASITSPTGRHPSGPKHQTAICAPCSSSSSMFICRPRRIR